MGRFKLLQRKELATRGEHLTDEESEPYNLARQRYVSRLRQWNIQLRAFMPHVAPTDETVNTLREGGTYNDSDDLTTDEIVGLPSDYSVEDIRRFHLQETAHSEMVQREACCLDLLAQVRTAVLLRALYLGIKINGGRHGQKEGTRLNNERTKAHKHAERAAARYNHSYQKLKYLRAVLKYKPPEDSQEGRLRSIKVPDHLQSPSLHTTKNHGEFKNSSSWIWRILDPRETDSSSHVAGSTRDAGDTADATRSAGMPSEIWREKGTYRCTVALPIA